MNRTENIFNRKIALATSAALNLKQFQQRTDSVKITQQIVRETANINREVLRSPTAKMIAATERIIRGKDNSTVVPPSLRIEGFGRPVARLHELNAAVEPKGFGSGFLVAPNILITNHHVFESAGSAVGCVANFGYQQDFESKQINLGWQFRLRPDIFFINYEELDFALVYVEEDAIESDKKLTELGLLPLIAAKGKVTIGSHMNIIQYPQGGIKKYTTDDNEIINIDDERGIIYYYTDTEVGSSGSPCSNDYWEVAALHYTGVPDTNEKGQWLTTKGEIWDEHTMKESDVNWIANAGKSISKIVAYLRALPDGNKYLQSVLANTGDPLKENKAIASEGVIIPPFNSSNSSNMSNFNFNFYGNATININNDSLPRVETTTELTELAALTAAEKKERFDEDYSNRKGYSETFIRGFKVPVPSVTKTREKELYKNFGSSVPYVVPYYHYSLVMNKNRRMVMWTACNVDYSEKFRDNRTREDLGNGAWRLDPRIPAKYQIQAAEFYDPATLVDKGHIVRRDDNCWAPLKGGQTDSVGIEYANADTFHWSNCTPQHEAFNRDTAQYTGVGKWGVLENAIKSQLEIDENDPDKDFGQRACVLAGPVLSDDDPAYMDIQYPLKFWKVFAIKSKSAGNLVYGFLLSQEDKVEEFGLEKEGKPRFNRKVKAMQKSLKYIEELTGVIFDASLHVYDVLANEPDEEGESLKDDLSNFKMKKAYLGVQ
ncbi:DNA/RNA non-specific endonuclease [Chitinophaga sp.]|uniref:DNA/RNA non-specific endonuclease n=1 Tax=Chitinophaga sp. TaxID=1869181 RepID=UPI0031D7A322